MWVDRSTFATVSSSASQVSAVASWPEAASLRERVHSINRGARIQIDPAINDLVLDLIQQVSPATADAFNRYLTPTAKDAFDRWPVATGNSKSLLALEFEPQGIQSFTGRVVNRAEYAALIHDGAEMEHLFAAGERAADQMAEAIAEGVARP